MRTFEIYNSANKKTKLTIIKAERSGYDSASVSAEYQGLKVSDDLLSFGGGHKRPFIRFYMPDNSFVDAVLTNEVIEYLWDKIGNPYKGLLYCYTENYRANWCD